MIPTIHVHNLSKYYDGTCALSNISFDVEGCGLVAVIGQSGSGKTTFLNQIGMLDSFEEGTIEICGCVLLPKSKIDKSDSIRAAHISYMFQDDILLNQLSIRNNILYPTWLNGSESNNQQLLQIAENLDVAGLMNRKPYQISRGQRQRASLIRAMLGNREILLADEPTGNLDKSNSMQIFTALKELSKEHLVIVATHDVEAASKYADRIVEFSDGRIISDTEVSALHLTEVVQHNDNASKKVVSANKPTLSFSHSLSHALASIWYRKSNLIKVITSTVLTLSCLLAVFSAGKSTDNQLSSLESNYFFKNMLNLTVNKNFSAEAAVAGACSPGKYVNDYTTVLDISGVKECVCYFNEYPFHLKSGLSSEDLVYVTLVKNDDFFHKKMKSLNLSDAIFEDENNIILASDIAQSIFGTDYISHLNETVTIAAEYYSCEVKIIGFNDVPDIGKHYQTYAHEDLYKLISCEDAKNSIAINAIMFCSENNCIHSDQNGETTYTVNSIDLGQIAPVSELENYPEILSGEMVSHDHEVIISLQLLEEAAPDIFGTYINENSITETPAAIDRILSSKLYLVGSSLSKANLVGIFDNKNGSYADLLCSSDVFAEVSSISLCKMELFVEDEADLANISEYLAGVGFIVERPYEYYEKGVSGGFNTIRVVLYALAGIMSIISLSVISSFSSNMVNDSAKEIGILKAMGANSRIIGRIYTLQSMIVGLICAILCTVLSIGLKMLFSLTKMGESSISEVFTNISVYHIIAVTLISIVLFVFSSIPSLVRISKIVPKDVIYTN